MEKSIKDGLEMLDKLQRIIEEGREKISDIIRFGI